MSPSLTVVKLGGSLQRSPHLPRWLALLARHGQGRVVLVPGGGAFADEARALQSHWGFDDVHGHNLAVLGMAQMAELCRALQPGLTLGRSVAELRRLLDAGAVPVWQPLDLRRDEPDELTHWGATADTCAAWLAWQLQAQSLWIVKACELSSALGLQALSDQGIVDRALPALARRWGGDVRLVTAAQWLQAEAWLVGGTDWGGTDWGGTD